MSSLGSRVLTEYERALQAKGERMARSDPRFSIAEIVLSAGRLQGESREYLEECATRSGVPFDSERPIIPFSAFRDLTVATAGGYLVATATQKNAVDILRPWSATARAGVQIETGLVGNQAVPKVTAKSIPAWLSTEGSQITPSQPTLAQIVLTPKLVGGVVNFSRQLATQANAEAFVGRELMRTVGTALDQAVINGSGASGQPLGILSAAGVQTQSGTALNAGVFAMKRKSAEANADDARISFLSTPAVRELLETRERATGGGRFVWDGETVADRAAYVSTDVPTASMLCGDFGTVYVGIWGEGFVLEINPYDPANFKTGVIQARIILSADVAVLHPTAFVVATSIT